MKIAVTGGSGFLGHEIVAQAQRVGHEVISISRGRIAGADILPCDILDTAKLAAVFEGCDVVVHSAALSAPWGKRQDFLLQNVQGTASVVDAANAAEVKRLIHVSSSSVYFSYEDKFNIVENSPLPAPVNGYAESKQKAEIEAHKFSSEVFIARPRGIYGPGDLHLLPRLLRVMRSKPLPLLREGKALVDITHVGVVADAVLTMAQADNRKAGTYNISHGEPIMIKDLISRIAKANQIPERWRALPLNIAMGGARVLEALAGIDPLGREPLVTRYGLGLFAYSHTLDISKAKGQLNWKPKLSLAEGLVETLAHLQK